MKQCSSLPGMRADVEQSTAKTNNSRVPPPRQTVRLVVMGIMATSAYLHFWDTSPGSARTGEVRDGAHAQGQGQRCGAIHKPRQRPACVLTSAMIQTAENTGMGESQYAGQEDFLRRQLRRGRRILVLRAPPANKRATYVGSSLLFICQTQELPHMKVKKTHVDYNSNHTLTVHQI